MERGGSSLVSAPIRNPYVIPPAKAVHATWTAGREKDYLIVFNTSRIISLFAIAPE